ncbi:hypothetical protein FS842_004099, partial [Serendipita sp. 407]
RNVWNVEDLKGADPTEYVDDDVIIINVMGKGAETAARVWCSERGKNAVVRAAGGASNVCNQRFNEVYSSPGTNAHFFN